jgi:O-antigen/teichoic acid export membrane protein
MTLRAKVLSGFRWSASVRLLSQVVTWAITLVVIRLLTPADYGLLAMSTVFVAFVSMFSEFGLGAAVVQRREIDERLLRRVFGVVLAVHCSLTCLLALAAPLIAAFYAEPRVTPVIRVLSLQFVIAAFAVVPDALLQRRMEFRNRSLLDLSGAIAGSLLTLAMAYAGAGVWALVMGSLLVQAWRSIGLNFFSPFLSWPDFSISGLRSLLAFGGHVTAAGVLGMIFVQMDTIICAKMLGNQILGVYSVAVNLASLPIQKTAGLVNAVAFPAFSSMQHDVERVRTNVLLGTRILSFFAFPVAWGISSIAPEIVEVILGPRWTLATVPLQALSVIIPLRIIGVFVLTAVQGLGRPDILLRNTVWALTIGPPLLMAGAYFGQLVGLSLVWLVLSPLLFIPALTRCAAVMNLRARRIFGAMLPAAGAASIMYGAVSATRHVVPDTHGGALRMSVLILVGALTYGAISFGLRRKGTREVLDLVHTLALSRRASP